MERVLEGVIVPMLGARELTMGQARPARYVRVPTCDGTPHHELCDTCWFEDGECLACMPHARRHRVDVHDREPGGSEGDPHA